MVLDQLPLGGHEEDGHLEAFAIRIEDLEVEFDVVHVEGDVLLGFPADLLAGLAFLHPVHRDLLDDHVAAADGRHDLLGLDPGGREQAPHGIGDDAGVHDLALDDGPVHHGRERHLREHRLARAVVNDDELDQPAANVQGDRGPFPTKKSHRCLTR